VDGVDVPPLHVDDPGAGEHGPAPVLVLGWGSTYGPIADAVRQARAAGLRVARTHLRHLNPFPHDLGDVLRRHQRVLVPEMNLGQLALLLRGHYLVDVISYNQVRGQPFSSHELVDAIAKLSEEVGP
jgi:2-oxoglutarate/2-oxoacid ferredoxin oxidoreductase subunit alpha